MIILEAKQSLARYTVALAIVACISAVIGCSARNSTAPLINTSPTQEAEADLSNSLKNQAYKNETKVEELDNFIERQKIEKTKQEKELQDLRRQQFHNDYFKQRYQNGAQ